MKECFIVLKRRVITSTLIILTGLSGTAQADSTQQAHYDACEDVKNLKPIDEGQLAGHDEEYINTYLAEYESAVDNIDRDSIPSENKAEEGVRSIPESDLRTYLPQLPSVIQAKFINRIAPVAQQIGKEYDLYPSVIIAQAALESDWGCSTLGKSPYNNLFGVKGYFDQQTVSQPTTEYNSQGQKLQVFSNFRRYPNEYAALKDYAKTLDDPLYHDVHRQNTSGYRDATRALRGRYATDPRYDQKLNRLIDTYQLTRYDEQVYSGNENMKPLPLAEKEMASSSTPTVIDKHPVQASKTDLDIPQYIPLLGGVGTVGLIKIIRQHWKKKKKA
ncbi:glycoside hydrolase family 73 protein [Limosilactobacillus albertensis]|uniref:Glucosaminidase domain-containing protein n=1 Tax=Limosilactobacillus albertensis TaxID=2759752 RepID=A0A839H7Q2_9LACO|nr:glucosaminidase domain-containing protein [Limosilactobacillus albertensis]MBB1122608.1 glucosaminidase domain-containing protein [Limosilactobacillus albertensis]MCD7122896.1 glucosaminidase domain-containing protein [Limosilactobacillus albertensis]